MEEQDRVEILGAVTRLLLELGFQAQQLGYRYLREAVWIACEDSGCMTAGVTKLLYPEIAKRFATTDKQVERAIRNSIETAWIKGSRAAWENLCVDSEDEDRPTNSEMILLLAKAVKKES